jgi:spiro-SPASM protein
MNAIAVLYGGALTRYALEDISGGKNSFTLTLRRTAAFKGVTKIVLLARDDFDEKLLPGGIDRIELRRKEKWNTKTLLQTIAEAGEGFDLIYFAWADTPLLDAGLAEKIEARHSEYRAEYSYADGWPGGLAPEILAPSAAAFLARLNGGEENPVERGTLFSVLQKDINSFDIETEISSVDLRPYRINLAADSKRNLLLIKRFMDALRAGYQSVEQLIPEKPELLRTLPNFFPIMVSARCPQNCTLCPYGKEEYKSALVPNSQLPATDSLYMPLDKFNIILHKIIDFVDDAVIDLSLWGELALHPQKIELIGAVLEHPELSLIIESCGIGWTDDDINTISDLAQKAAERKNEMPPLSWIISIDTNDAARYKELHGDGFTEAVNCIKKLQQLFPSDTHIQAVRYSGNEEGIEKFYSFWKERNKNIIIQKYDYFCGELADLRAGDISPLERPPCWHILRDMPILLDGTVHSCRETIVFNEDDKKDFLCGNIFSESPETIWERGNVLYQKHCLNQFGAVCGKCDEYYTYNF